MHLHVLFRFQTLTSEEVRRSQPHSSFIWVLKRRPVASAEGGTRRPEEPDAEFSHLGQERPGLPTCQPGFSARTPSDVCTAKRRLHFRQPAARGELDQTRQTCLVTGPLPITNRPNRARVGMGEVHGKSMVQAHCFNTT